MNLSEQDLNTLCNTAILAAKEAGELISTYAHREVKVNRKPVESGLHKVSGGTSLASQVVTEVDIKSQELILRHLTPTIKKYNLGLLTEEATDDKSRFEKDQFWCIDPLDGTLSFTEGKDGYSVSIALVSKDGDPLIGVVFDPVKKNLYHATKGTGAFKNNQKLALNNSSGIFSFITDRSFTKHKKFDEIKAKLEQYSQSIGCVEFKCINHGGAAMNSIWVMENSPSCYFKLPKKEVGGGSIWDFAATTCIFTELGLIAGDFKGQPLDLNSNESTFMNQHGVLFSSDKSIANFIMNTINK
ncbi:MULTISPECIES: 3'(2'),5'-bisphosphate nucleotidase CysQ family protein [unclassified Saccharicrinis]|uniref:3'(2'),5'-bisphosphate nucleotidase CysQ family protein n=1 Tax=unclassified Saccharicrinis TaxID=2646859 RepID=UPI003D335119